jgi:uracil phosphoribosyltransferase
MLQHWCVWDLGLRRDEATLQPVQYLDRIPKKIPDDVGLCVVLEIMLATGGSSVKAVDMLKSRGAKNIVFVCVVAAPEGIKRLQDTHPDVDIFTIAVDGRLTREGEAFPPGYITEPGLGDAGKRLNGSAE